MVFGHTAIFGRRTIYKTKKSFFYRGAFVLFLALVLPLFFSSASFAASLTMTLSSASLSFNMLPNSTESTFASSGNLGISVSLTGPGGYTLGIKAASSNASARNLINSTANTALTTISSAITPANYTDNTYASTNNLNNTWAYLPSKYNSTDNTNYRPAPDADGDILDVTSAAGDGSTSTNYTISLAARADTSTKPGSYANTFIITAIANIPDCNPSATDISDAVCMQDMNDNVINSMTIDTQYRLYDNRDWKQYYIARMKDGKVWMTQNLDLDLVSDTDADNYIALTSENTDLNEYGSNGHTTSYGYSCSNISSSDCKGAGEVITWVPTTTTYAESEYASWANSTTTPESINREYYMHATSIGGGFGYYSKSQCESNASAELCAHSYAGNYYNFSAATATNDTSTTASSLYDDSYYSMPNSVCPAGWRLPTGYTGNNTYSEANILWVQENVIAGYATSTNSTINYIDVNNAFTILFRSPLYYANTGYKYSNGNGYSSLPQLATGTIWNKDNSFYFQISNTYARPTSISVRSNGYNIRCIARQTNTGGSTTVTFNKNADDATGTMSNQTYNANTINTLPSNSFTRSGYAFNSWNTEPDGSGKSYTDADKYYAMSGNTTNSATLYAQWDKVYTVTFNIGSNATGINFDGVTYTNGQTTQAIEGKSYAITGVYDTKKTFSSWTTTANGTIENSNYQTTHYSVSGDATLTVTGQVVNTEIKSLTLATCPTTPSPVYDERDNEVYWVAKLSNDRCWMLDNLRLDPTDATVAANLSTTNTNVTSAGLNYFLNGGGTSPYSDSSVTTFSSTSSTTPRVLAVRKDELAPVFYGAGSGKLGVYYNYCAASAGTYCYNTNTGYDVPDTKIDSPYDLCPAGWRLPTGGTGGEISSGSKVDYSLLLSGSAGYPGSISYLGNEGHFWSATYSGSYDWMYYGQLKVEYNTVSPVGQAMSSGRSIRCLMATSINDIDYMQDFASLTSDELRQVKDGMVINRQYELTDSRDDKTYTVAKMADGNIWMTQNLDHDIGDIDGGTYTAADTDLPSGSTWAPINSGLTRATNNTTWNGNGMTPESYDPGDICWNGNFASNYTGTLSNYSTTCGNDKHYHIGNYYNWAAAIAMNGITTSFINYNSGDTDINQSICPAGWTLSKGSRAVDASDKFYSLVNNLNLTSGGASGTIHTAPTYLTYSGYWFGGTSSAVGGAGYYWTATSDGQGSAYELFFNIGGQINPNRSDDNWFGYPLRCVAR